MNGLLIFDHLNDVVFTKFSDKLEHQLENVAKGFGLLPEENEEDETQLDNNIIVQLFSPIVTSHRIMSCQFGNSYTSMTFHNDLNLCFNDYMGYLFIAISNADKQYCKKYVDMCVTLIRYLCGPDIYQLQNDASQQKSELANRLIDSWEELVKSDQSVLIEAVEQIVINPDLSSSTIKTLKNSVEMLTQNVDCSKMHVLILVENKFLSLYSSPTAKELSTADILFSIILSNCDSKSTTDSDPDDLKHIYSHQILLYGPEQLPKCLPHVVHIIPVSHSINLIYLLQIGNPNVSASLYETFTHLHTMQIVQIQRDKNTLQLAFENLDLATKRLNDSLKKSKNVFVETSHKQLMKKWDVIKKKYQEFLKNGSDEAILRAETLTLGFLENLKELFKFVTSVDGSVLNGSAGKVLEVADNVRRELEGFNEFFKVKAGNNFSLGSRNSLTIIKYLEEFPGLIHFLYIDRNNHRITTPSLDIVGTEKTQFTRRKVWFMVDFARKHLIEGHTSIMWKDTSFNYTYFLWFEDHTGAPLTPVTFPATNIPLPGIISEDYYRKIKDVCFPKLSSTKIRCYELFCVHLGLVTASCVLEQSRRLAATVWELKGLQSQVIDFL